MRFSATRTIVAAALLLLAAAPIAQAQAWPTRSISLLVGFAPGGSADILARLLAQNLAGRLGQPVVVENRPGAGATIAAAAVAAAPADGHALLFVTSGHAGSGALYSKLAYDPLKSFAPVAMVASTPVLVVVPATSPHQSLRELLAAARASPGKLNYGAGGGGATTTNLAAEFLKAEARVEMQAIPYKGSGPALAALLAGELDLAFDVPTSALAHVKSGKLRGIAVTGRARSALLPDVPTVAEQGLTGFEITGWFGVMAPAGTPEAVVSRLNAEIQRTLEQPEVKQRLAGLVLDAMPGSPAALGATLEADSRRYGEAIRRMGIKLD